MKNINKRKRERQKKRNCGTYAFIAFKSAPFDFSFNSFADDNNSMSFFPSSPLDDFTLIPITKAFCK